MKTRRLLIPIALAVLATGCREPSVATFCSVEEEQTCLCPDRTLGLQICREDEFGWQPCQCDSVADPGIPSDTDAGSENDSGVAAPWPVRVPTEYEFESRFSDGTSVGYSGQVSRHVLTHDLLLFIERATPLLDDGSFAPEVLRDAIAFYYEHDSSADGDDEHGLLTEPPALQATYNEISLNKNLIGKLAGNDPADQHVDWQTEGMVGWGEQTPISPGAFVDEIFDQLSQLALIRVSDSPELAPDGSVIPFFYVSAEGLDYHALLASFLDGAIALSQASDDYLDNDRSGKGLNGDNVTERGDGPFTNLEHFWDEGFGYFGAAHDLGTYRILDIAEGMYRDSNEDGRLDLLSEANFGAVILAASLDRDSVEPTAFTFTIFDALVAGRALIDHAAGQLSTEQMEELIRLRNVAVDTWEAVLAASAIASLNAVLEQMSSPEDAYDFVMHARAWSRMKGHLLAVQFSPRALPDDAFLAELHRTLGTSPVLPGSDDASDYATSLLDVRTSLAAVYQFDAANLGNETGQGGWLYR